MKVNRILTQMAFRRLCANGMVGSFSLDDGNNDQKKSFHSSSSCMYGITRVNNLTQFSAAIKINKIQIKSDKNFSCVNKYVKPTSLLFGMRPTTIINCSY